MFLETCLRVLVPGACALLSHPSGDVRTVVASALRRLVPGALRASLLYCAMLASSNATAAAATAGGSGGGGAGHGGEDGNGARSAWVMQLAIAAVTSILSHAGALLADSAPIPQYIVRLLCEIMKIAPVFSQAIVQHLHSSGVSVALMKLLNQRTNAVQRHSNEDHDNDDDDSDGGMSAAATADPQLAVLLRCIVENPEGAVSLLQSDIAVVLAPSLIATVYETMNNALRQDNAARFIGESSELSKHEIVIVSVDLLHVVLHFVIRSLSTADERDAQAAAAAAAMGPTAAATVKAGAFFEQADLYRRMVSPLRAVSPALLLVLAYVGNYLYYRGHQQQQQLSAPGGGREGNSRSTEEDASAWTAYSHLMESASRCLGILFDLYPEALTTQLLAKQSILLENDTGSFNASMASPQRHGGNSSSSSTNKQVVVTPRMAFSDTLSNPEVSH
jgi:hypothetical protein